MLEVDPVPRQSKRPGVVDGHPSASVVVLLELLSLLDVVLLLLQLLVDLQVWVRVRVGMVGVVGWGGGGMLVGVGVGRYFRRQGDRRTSEGNPRI